VWFTVALFALLLGVGVEKCLDDWRGKIGKIGEEEKGEGSRRKGKKKKFSSCC
jgi:hypothetical protein